MLTPPAHSRPHQRLLLIGASLIGMPLIDDSMLIDIALNIAEAVLESLPLKQRMDDDELAVASRT